MFLFKTSGATFGSVIANQKHAFKGSPQAWTVGELVLVSKNREDCRRGEKQIQYTMRLQNIRRLHPGEADRFWPGTEGRWNYLVECDNTARVDIPFDLRDVLGEDAQRYTPAMTFTRLSPEHEHLVRQYLQQVGTTRVEL